LDLEVLEALFAALPDSPFFVKDAELRYVAANAAMARLCGVKRPERLIGRGAMDLFPEGLARRYEALDRQVLGSGQAIVNKVDLSAGRGAEPTWLLFSRVPVKDDSGMVVGVAATSRRLKAADPDHPTYDRLSAVAERIEAQLDGPLELGSLAALARLSKSQLERDFHALFGFTPRDYLQKCRIEKALALLEGEGSIADISYACGYADHSAFSRRFRDMVGTSPRAYRAALRQGR
jgi:AraC-like DNA-binding protein